MALLEVLQNRCEDKCELCSSSEELKEFTVPPRASETPENQVVACIACYTQLTGEVDINTNHWRCLNESIWSEVDSVKVVAYRMLKRLEGEAWAQDLLNMMYLDEATLEWAENTIEGSDIVHKDSNGNILQNGDSVVLIKDLNVKGASFIAKRGTAVRRISLVHDNPDHIEGRINNQHIVILTQFVKKT